MASWEVTTASSNTGPMCIEADDLRVQDGALVFTSTTGVTDTFAPGEWRRAHQAGHPRSGWDLGVEIKRIVDGALWRLHTDDQGQPRYSTFQQFCEEALGMGYSTANRLMRCAEVFTRERFEELGVAKCGELLPAPEHVRAALLPLAKDLTVQELRSRVAQAGAQAGAQA